MKVLISTNVVLIITRYCEPNHLCIKLLLNNDKPTKLSVMSDSQFSDDDFFSTDLDSTRDREWQPLGQDQETSSYDSQATGRLSNIVEI